MPPHGAWVKHGLEQLIHTIPALKTCIEARIGITLVTRPHLSISFDITAEPKPYLGKVKVWLWYQTKNEGKKNLQRKLMSVHRKPSTHTVSFARSMASSSVLNVFTQNRSRYFFSPNLHGGSHVSYDSWFNKESLL